jgi:hypothetical protein
MGVFQSGRFFSKIDEWEFQDKAGITGYEGRRGYNI